MPRFVLLVALAAPVVLSGQALPAYVPVSPVLAARSALYAQPVVPRHDGWQWSVVADYTNAIEQATAFDSRRFLFDSELLQVDLWLARDLAPAWFVLGNVAMRSAHDGWLDSFLNWYHDRIGLRVPARNRRPHDTYGWTIELPDTSLDIPRARAFLGDVRLGVGRRVGPAQFTATITLPTSTAGEAMWSRGTVAGAVAGAVRVIENDRVRLEGGMSVGYTPAHGALAAYQREWFIGGQAGFRWRVIGAQALFATLFAQTAPWQGTGFGTMDRPEWTIDFGALLRVGTGWPALQVGMTEDLLPRGPAVDAGFKLGFHWER
jgi:hypothetical protein